MQSSARVLLLAGLMFSCRSGGAGQMVPSPDGRGGSGGEVDAAGNVDAPELPSTDGKGEDHPVPSEDARLEAGQTMSLDARPENGDSLGRPCAKTSECGALQVCYFPSASYCLPSGGICVRLIPECMQLQTGCPCLELTDQIKCERSGDRCQDLHDCWICLQKL